MFRLSSSNFATGPLPGPEPLTAPPTSKILSTPPTRDEPSEDKGRDPNSNPDPKPEPDSTAGEDEKRKQEETESKGVKPAFVIQDESLVIKDWEAEFAVKLFPLIPSPRAAKRFSNVYRILKARVRREELAQFEGTKEVPGDFQIPRLLLAMLIGAPAESATVFLRLQQQAANGRDAMEVFQN